MIEMVLGLFLLLVLGVVGGIGYLIVRVIMLKKMNVKEQQMDNGEPQKDNTTRSIAIVKNTLLRKIVVIAVLSILAMIPLSIIFNTVSDREDLYNNVAREIGSSWGEAQTLSGPIVVIPYTYAQIQEEMSDDGKVRNQVTRIIQDELIILPKKLNINLNLKHDFRTRGIYSSLVYDAQLQGSADFNLTNYNIPDRTSFDINNARIVFGVSSNQSIDKVEPIEIVGNDAKLVGSLEPGTGLDSFRQSVSNGFNQGIHLVKEGPAHFTVNFALSVRGSRTISILPFGEQTVININSDWPHPSFRGILPHKRNISEQGFEASWDISHLTRNYPQVFAKSTKPELTEVVANATLFEPVTHYGKIERSVKYGVLFILLTFVMLFIFELGQKTSLSIIQYVLVGSAMAMFYLLLLSLSEHISFLLAYLVAASIPLVSVSLYVGTAMASVKRGGIVAVMLVGLYAILYSILQLEDYALLMGTGLLLVVLFILMYITRHQNKAQ